MHAHAIPGSVAITPGLRMGGEAAAVELVQAGQLQQGSFKFFSGAVVWEVGQLEREIQAGCW